jgi:hypothetical protein
LKGKKIFRIIKRVEYFKSKETYSKPELFLIEASRRRKRRKRIYNRILYTSFTNRTSYRRIRMMGYIFLLTIRMKPRHFTAAAE